jgi:hypothetical protein
VAVADHQPVPALVDLVGIAGDVGVDLGLQRDRQHPPRALPEQHVQVQAQLGWSASSATTLSIAALLPRRRCLAGVLPIGQGGRHAASSCQGLIHRFRR